MAGGGESSRVFNVFINGKEALHEFDVIERSRPEHGRRAGLQGSFRRQRMESST